MSDRYLISVCTPNYFNRAIGYFKSLPLVVSAKPIVILLNFTPETDLEQKVEKHMKGLLDWVEFRHMTLPDTHSHFMVQDSFISVLDDLDADDLVCLTDLDIEIQRDFYPSEWQWLEQLKRGQVAAYHNCLETDNLALEAQRIGLSDEWKGWHGDDEYLSKIPCKNCGVLIARASTFRNIQQPYAAHYPTFSEHAPHRSRCQFLLNYIWHRLELDVVTLPGPVHQHGHLRCAETGAVILPVGAHVRMNTICFDGIPVIFRHNL